MKVIAGETPGWQKAEVLFNGTKPPPFLLEADDQAGYIKCQRGSLSDGGRARFEFDEHDKPIIDIHHGQIEIRGMPEVKDA